METPTLEAVSYLMHMEKGSRMALCQEKIIPRRYSGVSHSNLTPLFTVRIFFKKKKTKNTQYLYMFFETRVQN